MALIYETQHFILESHEKPEVDRLDGGHIKISPKFKISDRTQLSPAQAIELTRLSIVAGKAMKLALAKRGIELGRINYQENGNWNPHFHLHLYGRAINATQQKYGEPIVPGHKETYIALNAEDIQAIIAEIDKLLVLPEFQTDQWRLA